MAIVSRQEFADICGVDIKYLNVYISRKKVATVITDKSLIDTENPLNVIWKKNLKKNEKEKVEKQRAEKRVKKQQLNNDPVIEKTIQETYQEVVEVYTKPETPTQRKKREKQNEDDEELVSWDLRKKIADTLKAERAAELEEMKVQKMQGNLMPVDLVKQILKMNIQHILKTFENDLVNIASVYCDILAEGDRAKLSELIKKMRISLTDTIRKTESNAAQEIENVIEDYAEARSRGERR